MPGKPSRLLWAPPADQDLLDIWAYYASEASEDVADNIVEQIVAVARRVHGLPMSGRPRHDLQAGLRAVLAQPYVIFYRMTDADVEIVRVLHGRRDIAAEFANPG
jgi:toxin ParE1/3/4